MKLKTAFIAAISLVGVIAQADTLKTKDGSTIVGKIVEIDKGEVIVNTEFAGQIKIDQDFITSFSTDEPLYVTLENGTTQLGPVSGSDSGISIASSSGATNTELSNIVESWQPGKDSPSRARELAARRHWSYEAAFDMTGKTGNSESTGVAASFRATVEGVHDKLQFYGIGHFEKTDGEKSADDARAGVDYTNKFAKDYNWYARTEFGQDVIKDIEVYTTTAAGFGWVLKDIEKQNLELRAGLGYLFEAYDDTPVYDANGNIISYVPRDDESSASLDLGLYHKYVFKWGTMVNRVTYNPAIEDFGNFRVNHDSSLELPLKAEGWSIRLGINNRYDSEAELSNKEELDTTYYIRMVLRWL